MRCHRDHAQVRKPKDINTMNNHTTVYSYGLTQICEHLRVTNLARIYGVLMGRLVDFIMII